MADEQGAKLHTQFFCPGDILWLTNIIHYLKISKECNLVSLFRKLSLIKHKQQQILERISENNNRQKIKNPKQIVLQG